MTHTQTWVSLAEIISDDDSVKSTARQFVTDPSAYYTAHEDDLSQRGIDDADEVTGVIVIIDALDAVNEVAYLDWKSPADEVVGLLQRLPRIAASGVDLQVLVDPGYDAEADVETVVRWVNGLLAPTDVTVAILDEDSDAYPLIAVPTGKVVALTETAQHLGAEVRVLRASASEVAELLGTP